MKPEVMTTAEIDSLLERVRKATGPDRELDAEIEVALLYPKRLSDETVHARTVREDDGCAPGTYWYVSFSGRSLRTASSFTASIDAALALIERVLPGCWWVLAKGRLTEAEPLFACELLREGSHDEQLAIAEGATLPLAIITSLLLALQGDDQMNIDPEFIVICQSAWMNETGYGFSYDWDGERFSTRKKAIKHGWKVRGSDDFNIGVVSGDYLLSFDWMEQPVGEDEETMAEIAEAIGLEFDPKWKGLQFSKATGRLALSDSKENGDA